MNLVQKIALTYSHKMMQYSLKKNFDVKLLEQGKEKTPSPHKQYMLYAHIPFCHTFCPYCSFHKYAYDPQKAKQYFQTLRQEIQQIKDQGFDFVSMYVGGGTTLIDEEELLKTLELCKTLFSIKEISCETDPNHIQPDKLTMFKGLIDRLSCGIQSFDDEILKKVARFYKFGSSQELQEKIQKANGILPVMSLDLIFNFPTQTQEQLLRDLQIAKSLQPQQITLYPLMKSNLTKEHITKALGFDTQDKEYEYFQLINEAFKDYQKNNAWSFSLEKTSFNDEYVSSHHEYLGVGSGAFSFLNGELLINAFNLEEYTKLITQRKNANIAKASFERKERLKYVFLTEMFSGKIKIHQFNQTMQCDLKKELGLELMGLKMSGAIQEKDHTIFTTEFGDYLFMVLMKDFYTGMDLVRAVFRDEQRLKNRKHISIMNERIQTIHFE